MDTCRHVMKKTYITIYWIRVPHGCAAMHICVSVVVRKIKSTHIIIYYELYLSRCGNIINDVTLPIWYAKQIDIGTGLTRLLNITHAAWLAMEYSIPYSCRTIDRLIWEDNLWNFVCVHPMRCKTSSHLRIMMYRHTEFVHNDHISFPVFITDIFACWIGMLQNSII